jgi:sortase A
MPLYKYVKATTGKTIRPKSRTTWISFVCIALGSGILLWVIWPIFSFLATNTVQFSFDTISPIQNTDRVVTVGFVDTVLAAGEEKGKNEQDIDYTNANVWFPALPQKKTSNVISSYLLSIPKLKIVNANVTIGGNDLNDSLVHYGGTGLPGDYGNAVIFGHSTLPQFYNPTNYKTIFSLFPTLAKGDDIYITYDDVTYRYRIYEMKITDPSDLSALEQKFDDSYITMVTCVPPGTYWKRLNVRAILLRPT